MIHMIHKFGFPNQIPSAILLSSIILAGFIYVDDGDLFVLAPLPILIPKLSSNGSYATWISGRVEPKPQGEQFLGKNAPGVIYSTTSKLSSGNFTHPSPSQLP